MKRLAKLLLIIILLGTTIAIDSCKSRGRDCKGRKKTVKTNMGGWL